MWVESNDSSSIIKKSGIRQTMEKFDMRLVMCKKSQCKTDLEVWNKETFGSVQKQIQKAINDLYLLQQVDQCGLRIQENTQLQREMQKWLERKEITWRQCAKALWLREGDHNTNYFHRKASQI